MPRVCVLGYDGLELTLVEKLNLRGLLQREHGRVDVPIAGGIDDPSTPIVWTSFITGQPPHIHGVDMPQVWDSPLDGFRSLIRRHRTLYGIAKRFKLGYKVRERIGVKPKFPSRENIRCDTIFDVVQPSIAISVPVYNEDLHHNYPVGEVFKARQDPEFRREYEAKVRSIFQREIEELFDALERKWKVLMIHLHITDLLGHIYWGTEKLALLYEEMALLTDRVKQRLSPRDLLLIISDHGMGRYGHTHYGFYSLNMELGLRNPAITDFFHIIKTLTKEE
ncbi:hypothetical protein DRO42_05705 [Candidatus Bathyarchaeota archaeon]|nr:MAG: hypothetical protein DRO42_05705 [Candidatus Bathyarchaeota archaeon]